MSLAPISYDCTTLGELRRALRDFIDDAPLDPPISAYYWRTLEVVRLLPAQVHPNEYADSLALMAEETNG